MADELPPERLAEALAQRAGLPATERRLHELARLVPEFAERSRRLDEVDVEDVAPAFVRPLPRRGRGVD